MNRRNFIKRGALLCGMAALGLGFIRKPYRHGPQIIGVSNFEQYESACMDMKAGDVIEIRGTIVIPWGRVVFPVPKNGNFTITER